MKLDDFLRRHRLPDAFAATAREYFVPLADRLRDRIALRGERAMVLGISGAQGTGKSTLANFIREYLESEQGLRVAELSIDDFYLRRAERARLAATVHPLLATRGVPGTHDVALALSVLDGLASLRPGQRLAVPRFDKSADDRAPRDMWTIVDGPLDLVVLEGWCVGSEAVAAAELAQPINALERDEDADGTWRRYVNAQLATAYPPLFARLDALVFLAAPDFDAVYRWRLEQERKLGVPGVADGRHVMDDAGVARFIQHYERITRQNLERLPSRADVVLTLAPDHTVEDQSTRDGAL